MQKIPPTSRKSSAEVARKICKFPRILARRAAAEKLPEIGQRALRELKHVVAALGRVGSAFQCEKVRVRRRCHANFAPNLRDEIPKFPEIRRAARAKTACIRPATAMHTQRNVAEVERVDSALHSEKARVWRRDHASVAPILRERIAKFLNFFGAPRAQKIACTRRACALQLA